MIRPMLGLRPVASRLLFLFVVSFFETRGRPGSSFLGFETANSRRYFSVSFFGYERLVQTVPHGVAALVMHAV